MCKSDVLVCDHRSFSLFDGGALNHVVELMVDPSENYNIFYMINSIIYLTIMI